MFDTSNERPLLEMGLERNKDKTLKLANATIEPDDPHISMSQEKAHRTDEMWTLSSSGRKINVSLAGQGTVSDVEMV